MVLKIGLDQLVRPVQLSTSHDSGPIQSIGLENGQTGIGPVKPVVRLANRMNRMVSSEPSDSTFFFLSSLLSFPSDRTLPATHWNPSCLNARKTLLAKPPPPFKATSWPCQNTTTPRVNALLARWNLPTISLEPLLPSCWKSPVGKPLTPLAKPPRDPVGTPPFPVCAGRKNFSCSTEPPLC